MAMPIHSRVGSPRMTQASRATPMECGSTFGTAPGLAQPGEVVVAAFAVVDPVEAHGGHSRFSFIRCHVWARCREIAESAEFRVQGSPDATWEGSLVFPILNCEL